MKEFLESLIGKTYGQAEEIAHFNGYAIRKRKEDENNYLGTSDFRMDRINVFIEEGQVTEAKFG